MLVWVVIGSVRSDRGRLEQWPHVKQDSEDEEETSNARHVILQRLRDIMKQDTQGPAAQRVGTGVERSVHWKSVPTGNTLNAEEAVKTRSNTVSII